MGRHKIATWHKKVMVSIRLELLLKAQQQGFDDISEYIEALEQRIIKLTQALSEKAKEDAEREAKQVLKENEPTTV